MPDDPTIPGTSKEALLEHELRSGIYEILEERPGLNKNQLADELDAYPTQITYHVDRLSLNGVIEEVPSNRTDEVLLFLPSQEDLWRDEQTLVLYGRAPLRQVALYVAEHPGTTSEDIADVMGVTAATARHHLRPLLDHDLVQRIRTGNKTSYHPTQALSQWAEEVGHAYERPWDSDDEA